MGARPSPRPDRSYLRDHDEILMQRAVATSRIEKMRFNLGPMTNQLTAIGNSMQSSVALDSQGVEAARRPQLTPVTNRPRKTD